MRRRRCRRSPRTVLCATAVRTTFGRNRARPLRPPVQRSAVFAPVLSDRRAGGPREVRDRVIRHHGHYVVITRMYVCTDRYIVFVLLLLQY